MGIPAKLLGRGKKKAKRQLTPQQILAVIQWQHGQTLAASLKPRTVFREYKVDSGANLRGRQWWRIKAERGMGRTLGMIVRPKTPCVITLTRLSFGKLDEHDGLPNAFKAVVDGIADAMGIRDNNPAVKWKYAQQPAPKNCFGLTVQWQPLTEELK